MKPPAGAVTSSVALIAAAAAAACSPTFSRPHHEKKTRRHDHCGVHKSFFFHFFCKLKIFVLISFKKSEHYPFFLLELLHFYLFHVLFFLFSSFLFSSLLFSRLDSAALAKSQKLAIFFSWLLCIASHIPLFFFAPNV